MPETPDTIAYLFLGLAVITAFVAGYIATLYMRFQSTARDEQVLQSLNDD
jgi:hypothetical protein